ncbi:MAG: NADH-quinone oxidoreductase subunit L [Acidimicrobiales bacterium]
MFAVDEAVELADNPWIFDNVWLIPALPAASFLLILFFGKRLPYKGAELGIVAVLGSFALALLATFTWIGDIQGLGDGEAEEARSLITADGEVQEVVLTAEAGEEHGPPRGVPIVNEVEWFGIGTGANRVTLGAGETDQGDATGAPAADEETAEGEEGHGEAAGQGDRFSISIGTLVDGQSVMLLFVVTFISSLVHIYSTDYVDGDRRYTHYFAFLSLFTASMLFMVLASSTLQLIVGWELVGVCSFALIGHWWEEKPNSDAALKAFLTNRVGDIGLLIGVTILYFAAGRTFSIPQINEMAVSGAIPRSTLTIAALCLMAAVMSKSGQFILHTWLPDAMAGPTPVSALIHAATMVVAGVYMIGRLYPVFYEGFSIAGSSINAMAFIGGLTTVGGGALAFVQRDIKKVLAYSTVSQLGYMVLALGVGAYTAGMFHLFTHAFFKACLFLGAGSVSHACHHSFDMKADMGGLRKYMPKTFWTFLIGSAALAGIPPLAGFWSKDEILVGTGAFPGTGGNGTYTIPFIFGMITAAMTAAYMTRTIYLTFFGDYRGHAHPHESGPRITTPLIILAFMGVVVGFLNMPSGFVDFMRLPSGWAHLFEDWVEPEGIASFVGADNGFTHAEPSLALAVLATGLAVASGFGVWRYYQRLYAKDPKATEYADGIASRNGLVAAGHKVLEEKYYLDHLYTDVIAGGTKGPLARAAYWINQNVLDRVVDVAGLISVAIGRFVYRFIDQGVVDATVNASGRSAEQSGQFLRKSQTGQVREYATLMFGAAVLLAAVLIFAV